MAEYLFEEEGLNPVILEKGLGLNRGDITEVITYPTGAVAVSTKADLSVAVQVQLKELLAKYNLPRGKKPIIK